MRTTRQEPGRGFVTKQILVVEDDEATLRAVAGALSELGFAVHVRRDGTSAWAALVEREFDTVITELRLPDIGGLEFCGHVVGNRPDLPVVVMTGHGDSSVVSAAMRAGAADFLQKPFSAEELEQAVGRALSRRAETAPVRRLPADTEADDPLPDMIGSSGVMRELARRVRQAARATCPVLVTGETGTGKELVARALHLTSGRSQGVLLALNCAAVPPELIESELFGHAHGSFTGATRSRQGLFRAANGGTLFLDEIGAMPYALQSRLVRAMEARAVRPVGTVEEVPVDVRLVAATNGGLRDAVLAGEFREDLLLRLAAFPLDVPPLRERGDDVIELAEHFLGRSSPAGASPKLGASARDVLRCHAWPGNVRELENCIQAALVAANGAPLEAQHLPVRVRDHRPLDAVAGAPSMDLDDVERQHIERVLRDTGGNRSAAARKLGMNRVTLYRKLKRYRLE